MSKLRWLICSLILVTSALAQEPGGKLKMAVIVTRHGVRPPLSPDPNSPYARDPWPKPEEWGVKCPGYLTPTGFKLATFMGAYYSKYFIRKGILPSDHCPNAETYIWADNEERTMETSKAIAQGLGQKFPGCSLTVNFYNPKHQDSPPPDSCTSPYPTDCIFHPLADSCHNSPVDTNRMQDIANGISLSLRRLNRIYHTELTELQNVLICCRNTSVCKVSTGPPPTSCTLLNVTDQATIDGGKLKWQSRFSQSSTATENFLLEYANHMPCPPTGWNRVDFDYTKDCDTPGGQPFRRMQRLHVLYFERTQRVAYIAKTQGSNLANQILQQLKDGKAGKKNTAPLVIYGAHDTNLANLSGMLGISWSLSDLPTNDTPPAGALVFELSENKGEYFVQIRYVHANMKQMREQTDFAKEGSPDSWPIAIPKCPAPCKFSAFQAIMEKAIDTKFIVPNPPE